MSRPVSRLHNRSWQLLLVVFVALALWLPRGFALNRYATADENAWLTRSANFYRALTQGNWAGTFQRHHPGVTVTWAGLFGYLTTYPTYINDADRDFGWIAEELPPFLREHGHEPADLLAAGRGFVVFFITLALTLTFVMAWRAWGVGAALTGTLLLAFDPFQIAHARLMHLDGLLSSFMLLSVVGLLVALGDNERPRWRWFALIAAGIAAGLAWLTRSPGLFLLPFALLIGVTVWLQAYFGRARKDRRAMWRSALRILAILTIWALLAALTFVLLWPAMWVDPVGTLQQVLSAANDYATEGHADPIFFNGTIYNGDPGFWFYPITWLWRATPPVLVGLILALGGLIVGVVRAQAFRGRPTKILSTQPVAGPSPERLPKERLRRWSIFLLLLFAVGFCLFMNVGAKKFDRYVLPIYGALDLAAGLGWVMVAGWAHRRWLGRWVQWGAPVVVGIVLFIQLSLALPHYPYYLTYYNPWLGGGAAAVDVMQIGRGEGADQAARLLTRMIGENGGDVTALPPVVSTFPNGPFSYFYGGQTLPPTFWPLADYAVLYTQDWQRLMPSARQVAWLTGLAPLAQITLRDIPYARIYSLRDAPTPPFVTTWAQAEQPQIRLNAYELTAGALWPGEALRTTFYFENLAPIADNLNVLVRLVGQDGDEIARADGWPWGAPTSTWQPGVVWPDGHTLTVPPDTAPGYYRLDVGFYTPESQAPLHATQPATGATLPDLVGLDFVQVGQPARDPAIVLDPPYQLGNLATLIGYTSATSTGRRIDVGRTPLLPGEALELTLFWRSEASSNIDYSSFIHVLDGNGNFLTQQDGQPTGGFLPTSLWRPGQVIADTHHLAIPPGAPLGEYAIKVGLYDLATLTRLPVQRGRQAIGDTIDLTRLVVALSAMAEPTVEGQSDE